MEENSVRIENVTYDIERIFVGKRTAAELILERYARDLANYQSLPVDTGKKEAI